MTNNDKVILNSILETVKREYSSEISDSDFFQLFAIDQILKNYDITSEEIDEGIVDHGGDGQIDGFYTFINEELLQEDTDFSNIKRPNFEIFLIQAKTSDSYQETIVERVTTTVRNIFQLEVRASSWGLYNSWLVDKVELFKSKYQELAVKHPKLSIKFYYATKGDTNFIHPNVITDADLLRRSILDLFPDAIVETHFIGARELIDKYNKIKDYTLKIQYHENVISTDANNYIILSTLREYINFVTDENHQLLKHVFEANVRDYLGADVEVNQDINSTLQSNATNIDFWWLNNGITVLATNATTHGKIITLDNVQIVNGLQTTMEIWNYFNNKSFLEEEKDSKRSVLIRILITGDPEIRDKIIKATNFQNRIPMPSFRAQERIQRNIENYFLTHDWYYDRRKNYFKNIGKPASKIIGIPLLSQSLMAILIKEPYQARSRPTALIRNDEEYLKIFNDSIELEVYLLVAKIIKKLESLTRADVSDYPSAEKANFKFHVSMVLMMHLTGRKDYSKNNVLPLQFDSISNEIIIECFNKTLELAHEYSQMRGWDLNRVSKNPEFDVFLIEHLTL